MALRFFPLIHIIGLPGAGKTTLAKKLARRLELPVYRIGGYRKRFPPTVMGEANTWASLFFDPSRRKWRHCILETTGLNIRESFLKAALPAFARLTIKLETKHSILYHKDSKKCLLNRICG